MRGINNAMAGLSNFSQQERSLLVSIPYRVGIWVSYVEEDEDTRMDNKRERQALELVIARMAKSHRKMPFAASIMSEVQNAKSHWQSWKMQADEASVMSDLQQALALCHGKVSPAEVKQYKQAVWQIGLVVAQAFGEQVDPDNEMHVNRFFEWLGSFVSAPKLKKTPENMSQAEKTALKKLGAVLKG